MIETGRLRLRGPVEKDVPGLVEGLNDWAVAQWLIRPPYPYAKADAEHLLCVARQVSQTPAWRYVIADRETDRLQGWIALVFAEGRAELSYWMRPSFQGQGRVSEAALALLHHATPKLSDVVLFAHVDPDNVASQAILTRLGFALIGERMRAQASRRGGGMHLLFEMEESRWRRTLTYGGERVDALGLTEKDVPRLIREYRWEKRQDRE